MCQGAKHAPDIPDISLSPRRRTQENASVVVQCPSCQSKFRIADEKVTDKGVRVRCTSCKNVFQARRPGAAEPAAAPGTTLDLSSLAASPVGKAASRPAAARPASSPRPPARAADSTARRLDADDLFGMAELTGDAPLSINSLQIGRASCRVRV